MSKGNKVRFDEALSTLEAHGKARVNSGPYFAVLTWLQKQPNRENAKETVGAQLSLDTHSFQENERKLARAYLLLSATCGGQSQVEVKNLRDRLLKMKAVEFSGIVQAGLSTMMGRFRPIGGSLVVDPEMPTNRVTPAMFTSAFETARHVIGKARHALEARNCDATYVKWFGEYDESRYNAVKENIAHIATAMFSKTIHLRWDAAATDIASARTHNWEHTKTVSSIDITLGPKFFGDGVNVAPTVAALNVTKLGEVLSERSRLVTQKGAAKDRLNPRRADLAAAKQAIDDEYKQKINTLVAPYKENSVIGYPTALIHELTHAVAATRDEVKLGVTIYGYNLCRWLADNHPLEARFNADNYRLFCDEFL